MATATEEPVRATAHPGPRATSGTRTRTFRGLSLGLLVLGLLGGLATAVTAIAGGLPSDRQATPPPARPSLEVSDGDRSDPLALARRRTVDAPMDPGSWSGLGFAALEQGRTTADPAGYAEAASAFQRSLDVRRTDNVDALAGQAALADARHDFAQGAELASRALAVDPISPVALAALTDALTELGRYPEAEAAALRLDEAHPGIASLTRLSYQAELRGQTGRARELLQRAAAVADSPSQVAFCRAQEGLLDLAVGDVAGARAALAAGRLAAPDDTGLLHLRARIAWASGDRAQAQEAYAALVARRPTPAWTVEQADLLAALGDRSGAEAALQLARAGYELNAGSGVAADAGQVLFEADHGASSRAVELGARLYASSPSVGTLDAYAWALHSAGRDREAVAFADRSLALGGRTASQLFHRGAILAALGRSRDAAADLTAALALEPTFSPSDAVRAQTLLRSLDGSPR